MITGKDQRLLGDKFESAVNLHHLFFGVLQVDEFLNDVQHTFLLEYLLPEIGGGVAVRVDRIALASIVTGPGRTLIEGQEAGLFAVQLGGHQYFGEVSAEESEDTAVELETDLFIVAVIHPLLFGVVNALTFVLIFQLKGKDGDTVDRQHHIDAVVVFG